MKDKCRWSIRPGTSGTLWAYTWHKGKYMYLSKVNHPNQIESTYNGRLCPICGKPIECDTESIKDIINNL